MSELPSWSLAARMGELARSAASSNRTMPPPTCHANWTDFRNCSAPVAKIGALSGMSFRLYAGARTAGALKLFGFAPQEWDEDARTTGSVWAAHAAAAILAHRQGEQLQSAPATRDRIGQAKGIIMERYGVDEVRAFDMIRRLSQEGNSRVVEIAERVISSRS